MIAKIEFDKSGGTYVATIFNPETGKHDVTSHGMNVIGTPWRRIFCKSADGKIIRGCYFNKQTGMIIHVRDQIITLSKFDTITR